ncbi:hypothetical protein LCGC14_0561230 [marine sediment metagenome]|uniref:Uncharacterized protein n=1 Tax=marine sediment metagenome TaxID=412755 RepID=A0A0F9S5Q6_9ZZZZ
MIRDDTEGISYKQVHEEIDQFLDLVDGHTFTKPKLDREFNYASRKAKRYSWQVLDVYVKDGTLERVGADKFRQVDNSVAEVDWQKADTENLIKLVWPMDLQKYIKIYPRTIAIIAGVPGSGKTAFMENFAVRNMEHPMGLTLFNNDMSPEEIKERLDNTGVFIPNPPPFKIFDRDCNFGDVVIPTGINVIDYLDLNSDLYRIGDEIETIYRKLTTGMALIGIQKKAGQQIGLGGVFSLKRSKLYLTLDTVTDSGELMHKLTIVKARGRANPRMNPNGLEIRFKLIQGIKFWVKQVG